MILVAKKSAKDTVNIWQTLKTMNNNTKILVGKIVAPQGIRGEFRVQSFADKPNDFKKFDIICNKCDGDNFHFVRVVPNTNVIIARIDGIDDRNTAETLRGTELFIERNSLPATNTGEYYQSDLIGFDVVRDNKKIGVVECFQNYGAGDIIELDNGEMVSFRGAIVDEDKKTITVL